MTALPAPADADQAIAMVRAGLGYLACADPTAMAAAAQARYLRLLEQAGATLTAARASVLGAFTAGQGYTADGAGSARAWLMHQTGITRAAAAAHAAWTRRLPAHPQVAGALTAGELSESYARMLCGWIDKMPEACRDKAEEVLVAAAASGLELRDLAALAGEILDRARPRITLDPGDGGEGAGADEAFEDRSVRLETTFQGAGVLHGDLSPECAALVRAVLDALAVPAGPSLPLDIGYSDSVPAGIRNAVTLRDRHCRFPGCTQPARACHVHHVRHKAGGGPTSITGCVLLCPFHHLTVIHRWGWKLVLNPDGTTTAWNPDRTRVLYSHGPPALAG